MITISNFGKNKRLGNQIFQFSFLFGLHKIKRYDFSIPPNTDLMKCFDINCKVENSVCRDKFTEKYFHFDPRYPNIFKDNTDYDGLYQTEKYFKHCKQELLSCLKFKEEWKVPLKVDTKDLVSIHVRRGDYVGSKYHPVVNMDYINTAKKKFLNKKFIVFSDEIEWCRNNNVGDYYADSGNHYIDLYQMTLCSGAIIANSTFSWWGAYLTPKEKVVAPSKWFSGHMTGWDVRDVYCKEWVVI
jgi:hypothetical protein